MAKTQKEREQETQSWNNWKPGSGRKGWSPYTRPIPPATWRDNEGRPIKQDGSLDVERFIEERNKNK